LRQGDANLLPQNSAVIFQDVGKGLFLPAVFAGIRRRPVLSGLRRASCFQRLAT
jgi:hypothetical protein